MCLLALYSTLIACGPQTTFPHLAESQAGALASRSGTYDIGTHSYRADYATLAVPENRDDSNGRVIQLPVIRIHATGENSGIPIFFLAGGPGNPNVFSTEDLQALGMDDMPYHWLLQHHDFVMVGYRGFDGASHLATPRADQALQVDSRPLSTANLEKMAMALRADNASLRAAGVDVDAYNAVQVAGDMESARIALGYDRLNLYSQSYGTRVAYIYGLLHPDSIQRSVMVGANFPGYFVWEPATVEAQLRQYGELWKKDPANLQRSPELLQTMRGVLASLENNRSWLFFEIDPDKVKVTTFSLLYSVESAAQVFDAYIAAEQGDYSGLAYLSVAYDMNGRSGLGDMYSKAISLDHDPDREYRKEMDLPDAVLGSPLGKLAWGPTDFDAWPMKPVAERFRHGARSAVQTLIVQGNIDVSTPLFQAEKYLDWLPNAQLVAVAHAGHVSDVEEQQPEAFQQLVLEYLATGRAESTFVDRPMNFTPAVSLTSMAKRYVMKILGMALVALTLLAGLGFWLWRRRRRELSALRARTPKEFYTTAQG